LRPSFIGDYTGGRRVVGNPSTKTSSLSNNEVNIMDNRWKLAVAILLLTSTNETEGATAEEEVSNDYTVEPNLLLAYDCSQPRNIRDAGYVEDPQCAKDTKVKVSRNTSYQILQEEKHHKVPGKTCELTMMRAARYCGTYDHQTAFSQASLYDVAIPTTPEQCRKWHSSLEYRDSNDQAYPIKNNAVNYVMYEEVGRTFIKDGEVQCEGQDWKWGKEILNRMVVEIQVTLELRDESYLLSNNEVVAYTKDVRLTCSAPENGCQSPTVTYFWTSPNLDCNLAVVRTSSGVETTGNDGTKAFMSTDGSLVRLIKQEAVSRCGRVVYSTNYANIFLYELNKVQQFERKVEPGEVSISLYVRNRDDYLYNHLADTIEKEFQGMLASDCHHKAQLARRDFWSQHHDPGLTTWLVGGDVFATSLGDVVWNYQCEGVKVRAKNLGQCFQALPVELVHPKVKPEGTPERQWYMEPLTHRLTHQGVEVPCSRLFRPKYRTSQGGWIVVTPEVISAPPPQLPQDLTGTREVFRNRPDWSRGGIYTEETMAAHEVYQDFSRTGYSLIVAMANQVDSDWRYQSGRGLSPEQLFPELKDPTKWTHKMWSDTKRFLHAWGEAAAIIFSLFALGRIITNLVSWAYGLVMLRQTLGWTRNLVWTFCPNIFLLRQYREYNRSGPDAEDKPSAPPYTQEVGTRAKRTLPTGLGGVGYPSYARGHGISDVSEARANLEKNGSSDTLDRMEYRSQHAFGQSNPRGPTASPPSDK